MENKDYYSILGISDDEKKLSGNEFKKILKKKYRELAKKYHPDVNKDNPNAEEMFKNVSEAYEVLNDDKKRAQYDNPIPDGFPDMEAMRNGFGFNPFDFNPFGNMGMGMGESEMRIKGSGVRVTLELSLDDIFKGITKKIKYRRLDKCPECGGSGKSKDTVETVCPVCGGRGMEFSAHGHMQMFRTCSHCGGTGKIIKNPCKSCNGKGVISVFNEVELNIPKGVSEGMQFSFAGGGNAPDNMKGEYGDLYVLIKEKEHPIFERNGDDLYRKVSVSIPTSILGGDKNISTIDNKKLTYKIKPGVENGSMMRFKGYGMPIYGSNARGDMYGIINIKVPSTLNSEEKELIEKLKTMEHFKDD